MKLVLANNQSERFVTFYQALQQQSAEPFDYSGYRSLLFIFDHDAAQPITVKNLAEHKDLTQYNGVYINGYLNSYELAATVAICARALGVPYVNKELGQAPSLSKLTSYARLAAAGVRLPKTLAGSKAALLQASEYYPDTFFPAVLKRADADRGIDNLKVASGAEVVAALQPHADRSIWILQTYIENNGFYLVSFYDQKPVFCIFRSLEARPDGDAQKAHMFKPKGGVNASLIDLPEVPSQIISDCQRAIDALDRQIGSVDCIFDPVSGRVYTLEVNYNPQLVTIETFKDIRVKAFLDNINRDWSNG